MAPHTEHPEMIRLPGLFRRWELAEILSLETDHHIESAGTTADGTELFAVYRCENKGGQQ